MKLKKNRKLHGSVLLTVVSVMSLLIIFLFGTLVLASATNNRAHVNYSTAQTSITARSVVQSTLKAMSADTDFGSVVNSLGEGDSIRIPVSIDSNVAGTNSLGHADDVTIEYAGTKKYYFEEDGEWKDRTLIKITSNVNLAGVDSTSSAYIVKNPPVKNNPAEGAGFITTGGAYFDSGSLLFGGSYINLPPTSFVNSIDYTYVYPAGTEDYLFYGDDEVFMVDKDNTTIEADLVIYGDFYTGLLNRFIFPAKGKGVTVWGNLVFGGSSGTHLSTINNIPTVDADGNTISYDFKDIPYVYVDQEIRDYGSGTGDVDLGCALTEPRNNNKPFNIFARTINVNGSNANVGVHLGGDLYLMDPNGENYLTPHNRSNLYGWTASVINKTTGDTAVSYSGGNIYSKGNLRLSKMVIGGGVYCEGDLVLGPDVEINGDIVCGGNLTINGRVDQIGSHEIFVSSAPTISGELYINGMKYDPAEGMASLKEGYSMMNNIEVNELDTDNFYELPNHEGEYREGTYTDVSETFDWGIQYKFQDESGNIHWTENPEPYYVDENGGIHRGIDPAVDKYYIKTNVDGSKQVNAWDGKYAITDRAYTAFRIDNDQEANTWEAYADFYYAVDVDGNMLIPAERLPHTANNAMSYFDPSGNRLDNPADAFENRAMGDVATLAYIYPPYAERDVILGLATTSYVDPVTGATHEISANETQVVKQLKQLYEKINPYKTTVLPDDMRNKLEKISLGQVDAETGQPFPTYTNVSDILNDTNTIATELKADGTVKYESSNALGVGLPVITKSCILSGNGYSAANHYGNVNGKRGIVFKPDSNMLVVLDNVTLDREYTFIVDDTLGGAVYFYIPGNDVISGSETDVTNGSVTANDSTNRAVKDLSYGDSTGSIVAIQDGIITTSYMRLMDSTEPFQVTTDNSVYVTNGVVPADKRSALVHYDADGKINPPLLEQMHTVLGLKTKLGKPKAYVYGGVGSEIYLQNAAIQSVNILSSELTAHINCSSDALWRHDVWYNGTYLNDIKGANPPGIMGCFNANTGASGNAFVTLYVKDSNGDDPDSEDIDGITYKVLYYDEY